MRQRNRRNMSDRGGMCACVGAWACEPQTTSNPDCQGTCAGGLNSFGSCWQNINCPSYPNGGCTAGGEKWIKTEDEVPEPIPPPKRRGGISSRRTTMTNSGGTCDCGHCPPPSYCRRSHGYYGECICYGKESTKRSVYRRGGTSIAQPDTERPRSLRRRSKKFRVPNKGLRRGGRGNSLAVGDNKKCIRHMMPDGTVMSGPVHGPGQTCVEWDTSPTHNPYSFGDRCQTLADCDHWERCIYGYCVPGEAPLPAPTPQGPPKRRGGPVGKRRMGGLVDEQGRNLCPDGKPMSRRGTCGQN